MHVNPEHIPSEEGGKHTLIAVRRTLTEPKTVLAGVMPGISFAKFMASMAAFNVERTPSLRFAMVKIRGGCEKW